MTAAASKTKETKQTPAFSPKREFELKVGWPSIYPEHRDHPFIFTVRTQLVEEAEALQRDFLMAPDQDRSTELQQEHDAAMLGLISTKPPLNIPGFPEIKSDPKTDPDAFAKEMSAAFTGYFFPEDPARREDMRPVVRTIMSRYWNAVLPADYL